MAEISTENLFELDWGTGGNYKLTVAVKEISGNTYLDIRKSILSEDTDEFMPTKKGVCIPIDLAVEMIDKLVEEKGKLEEM